MNTNDPCSVTVAGGRIGEGIVVCTPGGQVGVVDAWQATADLSTNAVLGLLAQPDLVKGLGEDGLRFVILTHPHLDHFKGLPEVIEAVGGRIGALIKLPFGGPDHDAAVLRGFRREEGRRAIEGLHPIETQAEARFAWQRLAERVASLPRDTVRNLVRAPGERPRALVVEEDHDFEVVVLAPLEGDVDAAWRSAGERAGAGSTQAARFNDVCGVVGIRFGQARVLLGGDASPEVWLPLMRDDACRPWIEQATVFKAPHHGSRRGLPAALWASLPSACQVVTTCFTPRGLPDPEGLAPALARGLAVWCTDVEAGRVTMGGGVWDPMVPATAVRRRPEGRGHVHMRVFDDGRVEVRAEGTAGRL